MKTGVYVLTFLLSVFSVSAQINSVAEKFALPSSLDESSGAIFYGGKFITHNDSGGESKIFEIDTISGNISRTVNITNALNVDWEDITQDNDYIYIGDIGNNNGNRTNLKIYKIDKNTYQNALMVNAEVITFNYKNQTDFTSNPNNTQWDAEALVSFDDNHLILFSKNWVSNETLAYLVPKTPGNYAITPLPSILSSNGLITGGTFNPITKKLFLIGYTRTLLPFVWSCEDFNQNDVFSGTNEQKFLTNFSFEQTEAITYVNTNRYLISSESFSITSPTPITDYAKLIAFNEIPLGNAKQISVLSQPDMQNCNGSLPSEIQVQLEDINGNPVSQAGFTISAEIDSGFGGLNGTLYQTTDTNGTAIFDDLEFTINSNHTIRFSFPGLNSATTELIPQANGCNAVQWTGFVNSKWSNAENWSPQEIPNQSYQVTIPNESVNFPKLDTDASIGDLTIGSKALINLNGYLLDLNGKLNTLDNGSKIDASSTGSTLKLSSSTFQNIPTGLISPFVANLTIENPEGVTLNSEIKITEVLKIKEGTLNTNNLLILSCDSASTQAAQIDNLEGMISGNIIVEQCFKPRQAIRLISPSTTTSTSINENWQEGVNNMGTNYPESNLNPNPGFGTHITGSTVGENGFDATPSGNPSLFSYNQSTQSWEKLGNTDSNTLKAGYPYRLMLYGDRSINITSQTSTATPTILRSKGEISKGPVELDLPSIDLENKFVIAGNPFQASLDMALVLNDAENFSQSYVVWDPSLGGTAVPGQPGGRGAYVTINTTENINSNNDSQFNKHLHPHQVFIVKAIKDLPSLTFLESHKAVHNSQSNNLDNDSQSLFIKIKLYDQLSFNNSGTSDDGLVILFTLDGNNAIDNEDATKIFNIDENIARIENNEYLSYEKRALPHDNDVLELFISQYRDSNYTFEIEIGDFTNQKILLLDKYANQEVPLNKDINIYNFSVDETITESISSDRFELKFENTLNLNSFEKQQALIYPNPAQDRLNIIFSNNPFELKTVEIYDINAKLISVINTFYQNSEHFEIDISKIDPGMYFIKIITTKNHYTKKLIIN